MHVILYNAVSLDGFIADASGHTDWVNDLAEWEAAVKDFGCMIIGRKTHDEVGTIEGAISFVYTHKPDASTPNAIFVSGTPADVLEMISDAGFEKVILAGGGETNGAFAQAGLISEMILDVHPLVLGSGVRLFGSFEPHLKFELISSQSLPQAYVQNRYRIKA